MSKKLTKAEEGKLCKQASGSEDKGVAEALICQAIHTTTSMTINGKDVDNMAVTQKIMRGLEPQDQLEGLMAAQMVSMHNLAMDCSRRAMLSGQTIEGRDMNLRHATRLMNAFSNAVTALDKHKGKGQQKITVEHQHVQVEAGGQAIIGDVHHGGGGNDKTK